MIVLMFAVIVIVHEWGHYIVAKKCGVLVHEFAVGMGPVVWARQKGETKYSLRLFPLGGYCSMEEENGDSKNPRALASKKPWQKLLIVSAGAVMNFLLACIIMIFISGYRGYGGNVIRYVEPNMPAMESGLQVGDKIISIDGNKVTKLSDITEYIVQEEKSYAIDVERGDSILKINIKSEWMEDESRSRFGFAAEMVHGNIIENIKIGVMAAVGMIVTVWDAFIQLFTGALGMENLSSIVGVVDQSSQIWDDSMAVGGIGMAISNMMTIAALISANLAVVNLFPLPALDGGRIVFVFIEMLRGKPISQEKEGIIHFIGFVLLMLLSVFILYKDVIRLGA